jgi:predicted CXXCH cytochrome family protein
MKTNRLVAIATGMLLLAAVPAWATLGPHGIGANPCKICHDTASGNPTLRGWSGGVPTGAGGPWASRQLSALCYMCHESGMTNGGHDMSGNAYATGMHGNTFGNQPEDPDGSAQTITTNLPYNTKSNMECTSCHNVHKSEDRPFLQRTAVGTLCNECHAGRQNATPNRKTANTQTLGGRAYSTHPTNVAVADTTQANLKASVAGTNVAVVFDAAPGYDLGGHLVSGATGNLDCGACHAVHGVVNGTPTAVNDLLSIDNMTGVSGSALCNACHEGGANSAAAVGAVNVSDHPIDDAIGGAFRPGTVAIPSLWTLAGGQVDRPAQAFYTQAPVVGTPTCSSCHDTHGGIGATALMQHPQATADDTFAYGIWCWVCHTAANVNPNNHHSNTGNLTTSNGDINSQLICNDCHGSTSGTEWTAHNGFWSFPVVISATDSLFCEGCHTASNPRFLITSPKGKSFTNSATAFPATHGTLRDGADVAAAGSSHQVDMAANGTNANLVKFVGAWAASGGISQWGAGTNEPICESCHNILVNGVAVTQGLSQGWKANLLLQPYEDDTAGSVVANEDGPMATSHNFYTNTTYASGATGDALCRGCHNSNVTNATHGAGVTFVHNPKAHTIVSASYTYAASEVPYGRSTLTVLAPDGGGVVGDCPNRTTADAAGVPTLTTYPAVNNLDCDSCHRPHNASNNSLDVNRYLILETSGAGAQGTTICADCHDTDVQCN